MLEMFYGARKQVFFTFGPYVLILFYGANAATISLLFAVSAIVCFLTSPVVGRIIDKLPEMVLLVIRKIFFTDAKVPQTFWEGKKTLQEEGVATPSFRITESLAYSLLLFGIGLVATVIYLFVA